MQERWLDNRYNLIILITGIPPYSASGIKNGDHSILQNRYFGTGREVNHEKGVDVARDFGVSVRQCVRT